MELYCDKCWKLTISAEMSRCSGLTMKFNKTIIPLVLVGYKIGYIQLGAEQLSSHTYIHTYITLFDNAG